MTDETLEAAVVGGGVSGVYAAWRLMTEGGLKSVTVFEADDHIGGRLLSVTPPGLPNMKAELGGMRILPAVQPRIRRLIDKLNSGAEDGEEQIETFRFPVDEDNNISYLRGVHLRLSDFKNHPDKVPYHLNFQEDNKTPGVIVLNAIEQIVPGITSEKLTEQERRQMARKATFDGRPLYKQGFWQVLMRVMSGEAYQLALAAGGYESTLTNWNAADAIPWYLSDFGITPEYYGFKNGFQQVPLTIVRRFEKAGGATLCGKALDGFDLKDGLVELRFKDGDTVRAERLILAMPRRSLDLLAENNKSPLLKRDEVNGLIRSVTPRPLFKLFTTYECPWWIPAGVKEGRTTTDLPVRQTYYWPQNDGQPVTEGRAMLMASYDDGLNIGFWDGFRPKRGRGWRQEAEGKSDPAWFESAAADGDGGEEWRKYPAPESMVDEMQRQLALVHGLQFTPKVGHASFKDWGDDPFGGGWNNWNIGVRSWEVKRNILRPAADAPVFICGEAYSDAQGWVEGALETADMMLADHFGLDEPRD